MSDKKTTYTIANLRQDPKNSRKHDPRNIAMIVESIQKDGVSRSGVINKTGKVICGNGTLEALAEAGIEEIIVVPTNGKQWVVVQRNDLTEEQETRISIADNRTTDLSEFSGEALMDLEKDFNGLLKPFFTEKELDKMLKKELNHALPSLDKKEPTAPDEAECPQCGHHFTP